jgi:hypothetical protein
VGTRASAKPLETPPRTSLVSMPTLARWLVPGVAILLFFATWVRLAQVAAKNHPPLRLLALEGDEPWTEREVLRARCGMNGQFLAVGDRIWIPCAPGPGRWELIRWDLSRGVAERRWRATHSPKDSSSVEVVRQQGFFLAPVIAAAAQLPAGDLALVLHGQKPLTPVELVIVRAQGGLAHHPLPDIKPGGLVGFAYVDGHYELLTADCRRHVFEPGKPLVSAPLAGCPYDDKTVLEWSLRTPKGWRFVYGRQSQTKGKYALFLVEPGRHKARSLGELLDATKTTRGQKLDMSPGGVLPVAMSQWPTHRLIKGAIQPLERPPQSLVQGLEIVSPLATHVFALGTHGLRRIHLWSGATLSTPSAHQTGGKGQLRSRTVHRWRWFAQLPTRWIAFESLDRTRALHLIATAPARELNIPLPRPAQSLMGALPAQGGGTWLFDSHGRYLKIDDSLRRTDAPGLVDRVRRIWRLHHLQRDHLASSAGRPTKQSQLRGLAHRLALPVVLLGLPLLALIMLPLARRAGRGLDPTRPLAASLTRPAWPWIVTTALYLAAAGSLLWPFWQVTSAF